tara:strand:- start:200 stop:505 length:306 start_codon:yes stop_codon:yes gene_type:complete
MLELAADLLRGQALTQHVLNQDEAWTSRKQLAPWPTDCPAILAPLLRMRHTISAIGRSIAAYLSADRRRRPLEKSRHLPDAQALREADLDRRTFFDAEFRI